MNGTGWGIIALVALVVVYLYGSQIMADIQYYSNQAYINAANNATNTALKIQPKQGQQMCSLKVVFKPFFGANLLPPIYVRIDNGASQINWYNCINTTPSLADLVPTMKVIDIPQADLLGLFNPSSAGYKFSATLVADDGTQTHPIVNPVPAIGINNQQSAVGQTFTLTFVFQNIPRQHYELDISSDTVGINQAGSGNTYAQQINP